MKILKDILRELKIDLTKTILIPSSGIGANSVFEISPKGFLRFAKKDLYEGSERGLINGLTNAKRAIDCQIDECLSIFGIDFQNIPKEVEAFVNCFEFDRDIPFKLKIIQGLNMAPGFLISKTRTLRNKLEHYYQKPSGEEVKESIEIADLFIRSIEGKLKIIENEFSLSDENNYIKDGEYKNKIVIYFDTKTREFRITPWVSEKKIESIKVTYYNNEFYGLLRLMNSIDDEFECEESLKIILQIIDHPMPKDKVKLKQL